MNKPNINILLSTLADTLSEKYEVNVTIEAKEKASPDRHTCKEEAT